MGRVAFAAGITLLGLPALWVVAAAGISIGMAFPANFSWEPTFNREVHSHVENAYYANTPELMVDELELAIAGMHDLGLDEGDFCDMRPWKQVASCNMKWQYEHLESVIRRAEAVARDRDRQERQGTSDQYGDVYEEKMDNLRAFLKEDGWSDDLARNAFYVEHHPFYAAWWDFFWVAMLAFLGTLVLTVPPGLFLLSREA